MGQEEESEGIEGRKEMKWKRDVLKDREDRRQKKVKRRSKLAEDGENVP